MSLLVQKVITKFDLAREQNYSQQRTVDSQLLAHQLDNLLEFSSAPTTLNKFKQLLNSSSQGEQLLALLCMKKIIETQNIHKWSAWHKPDTILAVISCLTPRYTNFIQNIARIVLTLVFKLPSPCYFSGSDIVQIYNKMYTELGKPQNDGDSSKRAEFSEVVGNFFSAYSQKMLAFSKLTHTKIEGQCEQFRLESSMLGLALGDALGFLVEGLPRNEATKYVENIILEGKVCEYSIHKSFGHGHLRYCKLSKESAFRFGQYTDDTQCCRELMRSIVNNGGKFEPKAYARRLITLFSESDLLRNKSIPFDNITGIVGYGETTRNSTQNLQDGIPWELAGTFEKSQGNGGCMRVGPIGALYYNQPELVKQIASDQSMGTHSSSRCRATSVLVAEAVRLACESSILPYMNHDLSKYPDAFCKRLAKQVRCVDGSVADAVLCIPKWLKEYVNDQDLVNKIVEKGVSLGDSKWHDGKVISASAVQTSLFSLCCFLKHPDSYMDAVLMAIRAGGDTDTTAAICGSIVGARTGSIPLIIDRLNDRGVWCALDLIKLCRKLYQSVSN